MSLPYATFNESMRPVVQVFFTGAKATTANFEAYLMGIDKIYQEKQNLALVFNAEKAGFPGLKYQKMQARWLKENTPKMQQYCKGTAYVIKQPLIRLALRMIFLLQRQPIPFKVFGQQQQAIDWARNQMA